MMVVDGKKRRYRRHHPVDREPVGGRQPWHRYWPPSTEMCKAIPARPRGRQRRPQEWDRISLGGMDREEHALQAGRRRCWTSAFAGLYTSAASEVSLLWGLCRLASAGGLSFAISGEGGGSQDARPVGGMGAISGPIAAELGEALQLSRPVQQDRAGRRRRDGQRGRHDIARAASHRRDPDWQSRAQIVYEPMLPDGPGISAAADTKRRDLQDQHLVYDEPFWRADGLSGQSGRTGHARAGDHRGLHRHGPAPGLMCVIVEGLVAATARQARQRRSASAVVARRAGRTIRR